MTDSFDFLVLLLCQTEIFLRTFLEEGKGFKGSIFGYIFFQRSRDPGLLGRDSLIKLEDLPSRYSTYRLEFVTDVPTVTTIPRVQFTIQTVLVCVDPIEIWCTPVGFEK